VDYIVFPCTYGSRSSPMQALNATSELIRVQVSHEAHYESKFLPLYDAALQPEVSERVRSMKFNR
jgi:hypothetical protein